MVHATFRTDGIVGLGGGGKMPLGVLRPTVKKVGPVESSRDATRPALGDGDGGGAVVSSGIRHGYGHFLLFDFGFAFCFGLWCKMRRK